MADFTDTTPQPDYGQIEAGDGQAVSDAIALVWGLLQTLLGKERPQFLVDANRIVNLPIKGMVKTYHGDVSFGSTEETHDSDISSLGATDATQVALLSWGPSINLDSGVASGSPRQWYVHGKVISATTVRFYKVAISSGANPSDLLVSTHDFCVGLCQNQ